MGNVSVTDSMFLEILLQPVLLCNLHVFNNSSYWSIFQREILNNIQFGISVSENNQIHELLTATTWAYYTLSPNKVTQMAIQNSKL